MMYVQHVCTVCSTLVLCIESKTQFRGNYNITDTQDIFSGLKTECCYQCRGSPECPCVRLLNKQQVRLLVFPRDDAGASQASPQGSISCPSATMAGFTTQYLTMLYISHLSGKTHTHTLEHPSRMTSILAFYEPRNSRQ